MLNIVLGSKSHSLVCYKFKKIGSNFLGHFLIFSGYFSNIINQILHMKKMLIFKVGQMHKWMAPLERAGKTNQKNCMVRYDRMKISPDMKDWKYIKSEESAESAK